MTVLRHTKGSRTVSVSAQWKKPRQLYKNNEMHNVISLEYCPRLSQTQRLCSWQPMFLIPRTSPVTFPIHLTVSIHHRVPWLSSAPSEELPPLLQSAWWPLVLFHVPYYFYHTSWPPLNPAQFQNILLETQGTGTVHSIHDTHTYVQLQKAFCFVLFFFLIIPNVAFAFFWSILNFQVTFSQNSPL